MAFHAGITYPPYNGLIYVRVILSGPDAPDLQAEEAPGGLGFLFAYDTGCSRTVVDCGILDALGYKPTGSESHFMGVNGPGVAPVYVVRRLCLFDEIQGTFPVVMEDIEVNALPLWESQQRLWEKMVEARPDLESEQEEDERWRFGGLLGLDVIRRHLNILAFAPRQPRKMPARRDPGSRLIYGALYMDEPSTKVCNPACKVAEAWKKGPRGGQ